MSCILQTENYATCYTFHLGRKKSPRAFISQSLEGNECQLFNLFNKAGFSPAQFTFQLRENINVFHIPLLFCVRYKLFQYPICIHFFFIFVDRFFLKIWCLPQAKFPLLMIFFILLICLVTRESAFQREYCWQSVLLTGMTSRIIFLFGPFPSCRSRRLRI